MLQLLSFALFTGVLAISLIAIAATIRSELPYILRALGMVPVPPPAPRPEARRVRVIRLETRRPRPAPAPVLAAA